MSSIIKNLGGVSAVEQLLQQADEQNKYWLVTTTEGVVIKESLLLMKFGVIPSNYYHVDRVRNALKKAKAKKCT